MHFVSRLPSSSPESADSKQCVSQPDPLAAWHIRCGQSCWSFIMLWICVHRCIIVCKWSLASHRPVVHQDLFYCIQLGKPHCWTPSQLISVSSEALQKGDRRMIPCMLVSSSNHNGATSGLILIFDEINRKVFKYKLLHNRKRAVNKHLS